jgi:hypothetical protein
MVVRSARGVGGLTRYGKLRIAQTMYREGQEFVGAALLLRRKGGSEAVVLHLVCQGIEVAMKGLLLAADYDRFRPLLRKPLGHDLERIVDELELLFPRRRKLSPTVRSELKDLNEVYKTHRLRYASGYRLVIDPRTIPHLRVLRTFSRWVRAMNREGSPLDP